MLSDCLMVSMSTEYELIINNILIQDPLNVWFLGTLYGFFLSLMSWSNWFFLPKIFKKKFIPRRPLLNMILCYVYGRAKNFNNEWQKAFIFIFFSIVNTDCSKSIVTMCKRNVINLKKRKRFLIQVLYFYVGVPKGSLKR